MKRHSLIILLAAMISALVLPPAPPAKAGLEDVRRGAERGDAEMQLELGELYEYGFGLPKNLVPALAWYILSAEQGNAQAAKRRDMLKGRMTPEQVQEAERNAAAWRAPAPVRDTGAGRDQAQGEDAQTQR